MTYTTSRIENIMCRMAFTQSGEEMHSLFGDFCELVTETYSITADVKKGAEKVLEEYFPEKLI